LPRRDRPHHNKWNFHRHWVGTFFGGALMDWVIVVVVIASSASEDDRVGVRTIHYLLAPLRRCVFAFDRKG